MISSKWIAHVSPSRPPISFGAAAILVAMLSACGGATVSFKPGVQGEAMSTDERACRSETEGERDYRACMAERGYLIVDGEALRKGEGGKGGR